MANLLTFMKTLTVEQFKALEGNNHPIAIRRNPKTGKIFMTFGINGSKVGACAKAGVPTQPMISEVVGDTGEPFFLIHEEGEDKRAPALAVF